MVQLDPKYDNGYLNRGIAKADKERLRRSLNDYVRYNQFASQRLPNSYVNLYIWLVRTRSLPSSRRALSGPKTMRPVCHQQCA